MNKTVIIEKGAVQASLRQVSVSVRKSIQATVIAATLFILAPGAVAQTYAVISGQVINSSTLSPAPDVQVLVCVAPSTTCSGTGLVAVYPDPSLTGTGYTDPIYSNGGGYFLGFVSPSGASYYTANVPSGYQVKLFNYYTNPNGIDQTMKPQSMGGSLANLNGSVTLYPEWFGAVGDGSTDDTAAIKNTFAACPQPLYTGSQPPCTVHLAAKTYLVGSTTVTAALLPIDIAATGTSTTPVLYRSLTGEGAGTIIKCQPASPVSACIRDLNGAYSTIRDLTILVPLTTTNALYDLDIAANAPGFVEMATIENIHTAGGQTGIALGPETAITNNTQPDISHVNIYGAKIQSAGAAGIVVGNGTDGNVLANFCYGCTVDATGDPTGSSGVGVLIQGGGLSWYGGAMDENYGTDFLVTQPSSQQIVIDGLRSEGSYQFWKDTGGFSEALGQVSINGVMWSDCTYWPTPPGPCTSPNTYAVYQNTSAPLSITNSRFSSMTNNFQFYFGGSALHPLNIYMANVGTTATAQMGNPPPLTPSTGTPFVFDLQKRATNAGASFFSVNDYLLVNTSAQVLPGSGIMFFGSHCKTTASLAVCNTAASGSVQVASGTSVTVNTTAVSPSSTIALTFDSTLFSGCSISPVQPFVSARIPGTSFTITVPTVTGSPDCISYSVLN